MKEAWLALGANIGDPKAQIEKAIELLDQHELIDVVSRSTMIVSPPLGKTDQDDFHNIVIEINTPLYPETLLRVCLDIEKQMGRQRGEKWGPRNIDIDIIAVERFEVVTNGLTLPHPHAHERSFVIDPLREISPKTADWIVGLATPPTPSN